MEIYGLRKSFIVLFVVSWALLAVHSSLCAAVPDGYVVRVDSPSVYLDWGKTSDVHVGDSFGVYRAGATLKHPVTGEVLGQTEDLIGQGAIEKIEEKYSVGHIVDQRSEWKAGDRTRLAISTPMATPSVPIVPAAAGIPQEIWQSTPMAGTPRGLAIGDLKGDGANEVVVALQDHLEVYAWQQDHLEKIATYTDRHIENWTTVDIADVDHSGHPQIFAGWYLEGMFRARVVVLELSSATLKEVAHFDGFARVFPREDGTRPLVVQDIALSHDLRLSAPRTVTRVNGKFKAGDLVTFPRPLSESQLFGFAWGDWDHDKTEDWAYLQNGERLNILLKEKKWMDDDALYGGTKLDFAYSNAVDNVVTIYPRLISWKDTSGNSFLLVPHNESSTGIRFTRLKMFRGSELVALSWNGHEMTPAWRVPLQTYLADFMTGAVSAKQSEMWVLKEAAGDKTVIAGYRLP